MKPEVYQTPKSSYLSFSSAKMKGVSHLEFLRNLSYTKITIDLLGSNFNTHMDIYDHYTGVLSVFLYLYC